MLGIKVVIASSANIPELYQVTSCFKKCKICN